MGMHGTEAGVREQTEGAEGGRRRRAVSLCLSASSLSLTCLPPTFLVSINRGLLFLSMGGERERCECISGWTGRQEREFWGEFET